MIKKTAVILVNWNGFQYSFDCITSLLEMNYQDFTIVLVDNASSDKSGEQLKQHFPEIVFIAAPQNLGFTGGNNLGMEYAIQQGYTYTLLLNNDTLVTNDFLEKLVLYMDSDPSIGATQPKIYFEHDRLRIWSSGGYYLKSPGTTYTSHKENTPAKKTGKPVDWISGCAFFCRTSILKTSGLFAENMFMYYEDVDLSFRIKQLGYAISCYPGAVIYHIAGGSAKQKEKGKEGFVSGMVHYYNVRNRIWFLKKYTSPVYIATVCLFNFCYLVAMMTYFLVRFRFAKLKMVLEGIRDGMAGKIVY